MQPNEEVQSQEVQNPFALMTSPEAVFAALERSDRLARLKSTICRPLDKPRPEKPLVELRAFDDAIESIEVIDESFGDQHLRSRQRDNVYYVNYRIGEGAAPTRPALTVRSPVCALLRRCFRHANPADKRPGRGLASTGLLLRQCSAPAAPSAVWKGRFATHRYRRSRLLSQSGRLPMGLPGPHPRSRVHPPDRGRPLHRRLSRQLGIERLSRDPRAHLRPSLRARVPARPGRGSPGGQARAGGDLPPEARRRRLQGRHHRAPAARRGAQRQAHRLRRRRAGVADRRPRPGAARLRSRRLRR